MNTDEAMNELIATGAYVEAHVPRTHERVVIHVAMADYLYAEARMEERMSILEHRLHESERHASEERRRTP